MRVNVATHKPPVKCGNQEWGKDFIVDRAGDKS